MTDSAAGGTTRFRHYLTIVALIMAGEAVFFLPYLTVRLFRPTVLLVFEITNLELGIAFSLYGAVAMVSYALGGPLADRYAARTLMSVALAVTALGGLYMATIPSLQMLTLLYGFWGLTSILLFWAALLRATREWGGEANLGGAFGLLDGGRGLFAALMGVFGYALFSSLLPEDLSTATFEHRTQAVRQVILLLTSATFAVSLLVWFSLPSGIASNGGDSRSISLGGITRVLRMPAVWLQALIILCAYVSYKSLDNFALYAHQVMGFDEVRSAGVMSGVMWLRPVACIVAGLLADRTSTISMTLLCFFPGYGRQRGVGFWPGAAGAGRVFPCVTVQRSGGNLRPAWPVLRCHGPRQDTAGLHRHRGGYRVHDRLHAGHFHGAADGLPARFRARCTGPFPFFLGGFRLFALWAARHGRVRKDHQPLNPARQLQLLHAFHRMAL